MLLGGVGPALIFERGDGTPATRHTNVGGLATLGAVLRLDTRTALRLDAQQYFFSGAIADSYTPHLGTTPLRSADARARHGSCCSPASPGAPTEPPGAGGVMRIAVVGAGAVGGYFGARLSQGGAELVVIARGAHLEAIRQEGLRLTSVAGDAVVHPVECAQDAAAVAPADVVLLGVKAWQVADAAGTLRPLLARDGCVLPLQNGVEAPGHIDRALGPGHALGGLCRILSEVVAPGAIKHSGIEPYVAFGELTGGPRARTRRLLAAFEAAPGLRAEMVPDIRLAMWRNFS